MKDGDVYWAVLQFPEVDQAFLKCDGGKCLNMPAKSSASFFSFFFKDSAESMLNGRGDEVVDLAKTNLFR
jgi:hypothetical protein